MTLEEQLTNYANYYYAGQEIIPDEIYDSLKKTWQDKNPEKVWEVVGSDLTGIKPKIKLPIRMGSLAKCMTVEDFKDWWIKHPHDDISISQKMDGGSACVEYNDGRFVRALSRGDSLYGEEIDFFKNFKNVPLQLDDNFTGFIRGEMMITNDDFKAHFSNMKNPRNACAGIVKRLDGQGTEHITFFAYDVFGGFNKTEQEKYNFLVRNGFKTPITKFNLSFDEILEWRNSIGNFQDYNIDGIVIKQNKVDLTDLAREVPLKNVAVKPEINTAITTIRNISWQLAGSVLSPVAEFDSVELDGTSVSNASLANLNIMRELGLSGIGDIVAVKKSGMIIPKIEKVLTKNNTTENFNIPTVCPACETTLVINEQGLPECKNESCSRKVAHRFNKMFNIFKIKGTGDVFVKKLEDAGITISDFLEMCSNDNSKIFNEYAGGINGEKIYKQMKTVLNSEITASQFLATFDVKLFDTKKLEMLGNRTIDDLLKITYNELLSIKGFADKTATAFLDFMKKYQNEINDLRTYFKFSNGGKTVMSSSGKKLEGLSFCFTGKACKPRKELQKIVKENGGENKDSVIAGLSYLVTDDVDSGSSKNMKAKKLEIPVISSSDFLKMV